MWRFAINDSTWAWISGTIDLDHPGVYVEKGKGGTDYVPASRKAAAGWYDSANQEFWLFGGYGRDKTNEEGMHEKSCKLS